MSQTSEIKDSGKRAEFATGSVRDTEDGKGRFDLLPLEGLQEVAIHYQQGAKKYAARNWEKGQPLSRIVSSMVRHAVQAANGMKDENHAAAVAWNALALITLRRRIERGVLPKELDDLPTWKDGPVVVAGQAGTVSINEGPPIPVKSWNVEPRKNPCLDEWDAKAMTLVYNDNSIDEIIRQACPPAGPDSVRELLENSIDEIIRQACSPAGPDSVRELLESTSLNGLCDMASKLAALMREGANPPKKEKPYLLYVSGKITDSRGPWYEEQNRREAEAVARQLTEWGFATICPHTNGRYIDSGLEYDLTIQRDLVVLERCDGVVMVPNWKDSKGAKIEYDHAIKNDIPVFYWRQNLSEYAAYPSLLRNTLARKKVG